MTSGSRKSVLRKIFPKHEKSAMGSLEVFPREIRFKTQNPGERVYVLARAHIITNFGWIVRTALLVVLPILVFILLETIGFDINNLPEDILAISLMAYYLTISIQAIANIAKWYYNIYLVTSERMIHYKFKPLAMYKVSEAEISNIQDVSQSSIGLIPNIFGYGDILLQTASRHNKFYFRSVPKPLWFRDVITDLARLTRVYEP